MGECLLVALCGETFAARVSGSILTAVGLPELVTRSLSRLRSAGAEKSQPGNRIVKRCAKN